MLSRGEWRFVPVHGRGLPVREPDVGSAKPESKVPDPVLDRAFFFSASDRGGAAVLSLMPDLHEVSAALAPEATETVACLVCGSEEEGLVVGTRGRFGMAVTNVVCPTCTLVYQNPRPSQEAMNAYYGGAYREHYGSVAYRDQNGVAAAPGDEAYERTLAQWHEMQARNARTLCNLRPGERVLEVGCRDARTLRLLAEQIGIVPFGVEPGPAQAAEARAHGVDCFAGVLEDYEPPTEKLHQVQLLHVLEHLHDPLGALLRIREWLVPGGRLYIEVPNVYQPYGSLEGNFFQNAHLTNFSWTTLGELFRRAGFTPLSLIDETALFGVAVKNELPSDALPLPFSPEALLSHEEDASWVYERLRSYAAVEEYRQAILRRGATEDEIRKLAMLLSRPAFPAHLSNTLGDLVEAFMRSGSPRPAFLLLEGALAGPHEPALLERLGQLAGVVMDAMPFASTGTGP